MRMVDAQRENEDRLFTYEEVKKIVRDAPTIDAEPVRHGRFIFEKGDGVALEDGWICTACKFGYHTNVPYFKSFAYCPNCGAKMERGCNQWE